MSCSERYQDHMRSINNFSITLHPTTITVSDSKFLCLQDLVGFYAYATPRGKAIYAFIASHSFNIMNNRAPTYIVYCTESRLDLSMCSTLIEPDLQWTVATSLGDATTVWSSEMGWALQCATLQKRASRGGALWPRSIFSSGSGPPFVQERQVI